MASRMNEDDLRAKQENARMRTMMDDTPMARSPAFDLEKCMRDGGKCLAGDRPARVVCTDRLDSYAPLVVLVVKGDREILRSYGTDGASFPLGEDNIDRDLRNIPEEKVAEVMLLVSKVDPDRVIVTTPNQDYHKDYWKLYGPPQKVTFPKD